MKDLLPPAYSVKERGKVTVKGKGEMITYWVESKANRIPPTKEDVSDILLSSVGDQLWWVIDLAQSSVALCDEKFMNMVNDFLLRVTHLQSIEIVQLFPILWLEDIFICYFQY